MRDIVLADTVYIAFTTRAFATGIPIAVCHAPGRIAAGLGCPNARVAGPHWWPGGATLVFGAAAGGRCGWPRTNTGPGLCDAKDAEPTDG